MVELPQGNLSYQYSSLTSLPRHLATLKQWPMARGRHDDRDAAAAAIRPPGEAVTADFGSPQSEASP